MMRRCKYCGSDRHKSKDCMTGKFGRGEVNMWKYDVEIDASNSMETLFKAIEILHQDLAQKKEVQT